MKSDQPAAPAFSTECLMSVATLRGSIPGILTDAEFAEHLISLGVKDAMAKTVAARKMIEAFA